MAPPEFTFPVLPIDMSLTATTAIPRRRIATAWAMIRRPILEARNFLTLIEAPFVKFHGHKTCGLQVHTNEIYFGIATSRRKRSASASYSEVFVGTKPYD